MLQPLPGTGELTYLTEGYLIMKGDGNKYE